MKDVIDKFSLMVISVVAWIVAIFIYSLSITVSLGVFNALFGWTWDMGITLNVFGFVIVFCAIIVFILTIEFEREQIENKPFDIDDDPSSRSVRKYIEKKDLYEIVIKTCAIWRNIGIVIALCLLIFVDYAAVYSVAVYFPAQCILLFATFITVIVIPIIIKIKFRIDNK
jgi:hypothetical protein